MNAGIRDQAPGVNDQGSDAERQSDSCRLTPVTWLLTPVRWLLGRRGDLVWNTLVVITVLIPLAGLAIDVPRYFTLRTRLQLAADAAAEAAARSVDVAHFRETGEVRLSGDAYGNAGAEFARATGDLVARGYAPALGAIQVDEGGDTVTVQASGTTQVFFALSPSFTVPVVAQSRFRMIEGG